MGKNPWFAANLSWLMTQSGATNASLARVLLVSRESVGQWRKSKARPMDENMAALCAALDCTKDELLTYQPHPPHQKKLTMVAWARRENIPVTRAHDLFALGILSGAQKTDFAMMVPIQMVVPEDSKNLVFMLKRRPSWVPNFHANFRRLVKSAKTDFTTIGIISGVQPNSVSHWANGRNYPQVDRLPMIARALGVSMQELLGENSIMV